MIRNVGIVGSREQVRRCAFGVNPLQILYEIREDGRRAKMTIMLEENGEGSCESYGNTGLLLPFFFFCDMLPYFFGSLVIDFGVGVGWRVC